MTFCLTSINIYYFSISLWNDYITWLRTNSDQHKVARCSHFWHKNSCFTGNSQFIRLSAQTHTATCMWEAHRCKMSRHISWFTFEKIKGRLRDKDVQTVILQQIPWHYHVPLAPKEPSPCTKTHSTVRNHNFTLPATGFIFLSCFHTISPHHMRATVYDTEMPVSYHQSQRK